MELKLYEQDEFERLMHAYKEGKIATLEEAFPKLTPKAIDFIRYGVLPGEWDTNEWIRNRVYCWRVAVGGVFDVSFVDGF